MKRTTALALLAILAALVWLSGCNTLCTRHLYLFRDTEAKSLPPAQMALVITDPNILAAVLPEAAGQVQLGLPWAPEQLGHETDRYRLAVMQIDGQPIYQGLCLDTLLTDVCEVRPGARQILARAYLVGPWGKDNQDNTAAVQLAAGGVYFLHQNWQMIADKHFRLTVLKLAPAYDQAVRGRLMSWLRANTKGRTLE